MARRGYHQRPHGRTSVLGNQFQAGRGQTAMLLMQPKSEQVALRPPPGVLLPKRQIGIPEQMISIDFQLKMKELGISLTKKPYLALYHLGDLAAQYVGILDENQDLGYYLKQADHFDKEHLKGYYMARYYFGKGGKEGEEQLRALDRITEAEWKDWLGNDQLTLEYIWDMFLSGVTEILDKKNPSHMWDLFFPYRVTPEDHPLQMNGVEILDGWELHDKFTDTGISYQIYHLTKEGFALKLGGIDGDEEWIYALPAAPRGMMRDWLRGKLAPKMRLRDPAMPAYF